MLKDKTVLLGVTGSIAAYKIAYLASALKKLHADVHVLMTKNAVNFINPITFETLTGNKCLVDTFDRNFEYSVEHVSLAKKADIVMIAPASANVIGKVAHGIADDMLTTTVMACRCKKFIAPAMNTNMYENPIVQDNLKILQVYGYGVVDPAVGYLACGDTGAGKMVEPDVLLDVILQEIAYEKDLAGLKILVTAGPTQEAVDPVRYITNHSTGKMGYAIAKIASRRGAEEYEVCCTALEKLSGQDEWRQKLREELRRKRSVCLKLMQQLGIDTTDWNRVNEFCNNPRIAGKPFVQVSTAELEQLAIKLRAIQRKGGLTDK